MNSTTPLKMVVCGVALVSLSAIRPASGQTVGPCFGSGFFSGTAIQCAEFDPGPQEQRVDFAGNHSFKIIANVVQKFFLEIVSTPITPPGPVTRYPEATEKCIPYVFATPTLPGDCALYDVTAFDENGNEIPNEDAGDYIDGQIIYRIAWDHPTLEEFACPGVNCYDNPRGAPRRRQQPTTPFFDMTDGVFPTLMSGEDPGRRHVGGRLLAVHRRPASARQ